MALILAFLVGGTWISVGMPVEVSAASNCDSSFLGFQPWYKGLTTEVNGKCEIQGPESEEGIPGFVLQIMANVLVDIFSVIGYLALGFIIYGGYLYIMAGGDPGKVAKGKKTITAAVIGLVIAVSANIIVNLLVAVFTGGGA